MPIRSDLAAEFGFPFRSSQRLANTSPASISHEQVIKTLQSVRHSPPPSQNLEKCAQQDRNGARQPNSPYADRRNTVAPTRQLVDDVSMPTTEETCFGSGNSDASHPTATKISLIGIIEVVPAERTP